MLSWRELLNQLMMKNYARIEITADKYGKYGWKVVMQRNLSTLRKIGRKNYFR